MNINGKYKTNQSDIDVSAISQRCDFLEKRWIDFSESAIGRLYFKYRSLVSILENFVAALLKLKRKISQDGIKKLCLHIFGIKKTKIRMEDEICVGNSEENHISQNYLTTNIEKLKIAWVVYGYLPKGGGHRNIFRMAYFLERFGHEVKLYITDTRLGSTSLSDQIRNELYPIAGDIIAYNGDIQSADVLIGTHWESIKYIDNHKDKARALCYFVQDYEPMFYPMGSNYLLAQDTYRRGYQHICSGEWVYKKICSTHNAIGGFFNFPIDKQVYFNTNEERRKNSIVFFAKPEMDRRCFEIGILALEELSKIRSDFEVVLFGSNELAKFKFNFPHKVLKFAKSINDLAKIYNESEIGIAFSTTNPSLVPYEMMACGLVVVDLYTELSEFNYGGSFDVALLCHPNPKEIADRVSNLMNSPDDIIKRRTSGLNLASEFPTEEAAARIVESLIYDTVKSSSVRNEIL